MFHVHVYGPQRKSVWFFNLTHLELLEVEEGVAGPHPVGQIGLIAKECELNLIHLAEIAEDNEVSILVHPVMEDEIAAHSTHAQWYGKEIELNLDFFLPG